MSIIRDKSSQERVGKRVIFPIIEAETMGVEEVARGDEAMAVVSFTCSNQKIGYALDENDVANLIQCLQDVLPYLIEYNHPNGKN